MWTVRVGHEDPRFDTARTETDTSASRCAGTPRPELPASGATPIARKASSRTVGWMWTAASWRQEEAMIGHRRRSLVLAVLSAMLVVACGGATQSASAPVASQAASQPASVAPSAAAEIDQGLRRLRDARSRSRGTASSTPPSRRSRTAGRIDVHVHRRHRLRRRHGARPARGRGAASSRTSSSATPSATRRPSRRVAADYPDIAFVFGSGGGPAEPNFSRLRQLDPRAGLPGRHARGRPDRSRTSSASSAATRCRR